MVRLKYTHAAIYHVKHYLTGPYYEFHLCGPNPGAKTRSAVPITEESPEKAEGSLITVVPLNKEHQEEIEREVRRPLWFEEHPLGFIGYDRRGTLCISRTYHPKNKLMDYTARYTGGKRPLKGLGAQLEHACLTHLKTLGVTHVKTTHAPDDPRVEQLEKLGLPIDTPVPIDEWMNALKNGFPEPDAPKSRLRRAWNRLLGR